MKGGFGGDTNRTEAHGSFVQSSRDRQQRQNQIMEIQQSKAIAGLESAQRDKEYSVKNLHAWAELLDVQLAD